MKRIIALVAGLAILVTSCNKRDGEETSESAGKVLQEKNWRMTGYYEDEVDKLVYFTGYSFKFIADGTVTATKNGTQNVGNWIDSVLTDSTPNIKSLRFKFDDSKPFKYLNKNWEVYEKTTKEIHLRAQDMQDGAYDHIFFRINY